MNPSIKKTRKEGSCTSAATSQKNGDFITFEDGNDTTNFREKLILTAKSWVHKTLATEWAMFKELVENVSNVLILRNDTLTENQGAFFEDDDPKFAALMAESEESGSEYKGGSDGVESESESEPDSSNAQLSAEGPELEDEEPDTNIKIKSGKKQKKGLIARDQISAAVAAINNESSPRLDRDRDHRSKTAAVPGSKSHQPG